MPWGHQNQYGYKILEVQKPCHGGLGIPKNHWRIQNTPGSILCVGAKSTRIFCMGVQNIGPFLIGYVCRATTPTTYIMEEECCKNPRCVRRIAQLEEELLSQLPILIPLVLIM